MIGPMNIDEEVENSYEEISFDENKYKIGYI